jgi:membrane protein
VAVTTLLIAAVFKILPDVLIRWRDLWVGAAFTAFLFYLGQLIVGLYLSRANVGSIFGAAGSLTAVLVWIYYTAQILLFGAEFTEVWARYHGVSLRPDSDATWINEAQARREAARANVGFDETDTEEHKAALMREQRKREAERVRKLTTAVRRRRE